MTLSESHSFSRSFPVIQSRSPYVNDFYNNAVTYVTVASNVSIDFKEVQICISLSISLFSAQPRCFEENIVNIIYYDQRGSDSLSHYKASNRGGKTTHFE